MAMTSPSSTTPPSSPPDLASRRLAVEAPGHVFVWASAGTGKTYLLTQRALRLILHAPFHPLAKNTPAEKLYTTSQRSERLQAGRSIFQRFVLTTFTRKAAAEMQTRLCGVLNDIASCSDRDQLPALSRPLIPQQFLDPNNFPKLQPAAEALAEMATELQISTIHSLAARILRRHPAAAGIGPDVVLAEEEDTPFRDLTGLVLNRWWEHVATVPSLQHALTTLLHRTNLEEIRTWLELALAHPWLPHHLEFERPKPDELERTINTLKNLAAIEVEERFKNIQKSQSQIDEGLINWQEHHPNALSTLCQKLPSILKSLCSKKNIQNHIKEPLDPDQIVSTLVRECLHTELSDTWPVWREFLGRFADWSRDALVRELGVVTYDELVRRAVRLLQDHPEVRRVERQRLIAILVDEFQDTDPDQLNLLELLLGRESSTDHLVEGFFVGDRKQSIYRFRKVDLPAIDAFRARFPAIVHASPGNITEVHLTTSFRSSREIVSFVNNQFHETFAARASTAISTQPVYDYAPEALQPHPDAPTTSPPVLVHRLDFYPKPRAAQQRRALADHITQAIHDYLRADPNHHPRDVLVLVRNHGELTAMSEALEAEGLPHVSAGSLTFHRHPEVLDALNLLIALWAPADSLAVGAVLHSPILGLGGSEVVSLLDAIPTDRVFGSDDPLPETLPPHARQRIQRLRQLHRQRTELPIAEWLAQLQPLLPYATYTTLDPEGKSHLRVRAVLDSFRQIYEQGRIPPLVWLLEERNRSHRVDRFDEKLGEDVSLTDESADAIRVMTIHKAKGLEAKFVVIFNWATILSTGRPVKKPVLEITEPGGRTLREFSIDWAGIPIASLGYAHALALDESLEARERMRLAYVAATRPQHQLLIVFTPGLRHGQPYIITTSVVVSPPPPTGPSQQPAPEISLDPERYRAVWQARWLQAATPPPLLLRHPSLPADEPPPEHDRDLPEAVTQRIARARTDALIAGILVHRYLQRHLLDPEFQPPAWHRLVELSDHPPPTPQAIERAQRALQRFFQSAYHNRLQRAHVLARELRFLLHHEGIAWTGVIDLLLEEGNHLTIVDFKLSPPQQPLPETYQRQQHIYEAAIRARFPNQPVTTEFWWLE